MPAPTPITTGTAPPEFAHAAEYHLGMVNPPRRVKRLREIALKEPSSSIAPVTPSLSPSSTSSDTRASLPPASPAAAPRRRGRKPAGPLSKSAREQLRKTNHSVIEKRRREKINEALAALRELVPHEKQEGEKKEDKEFKLEVLVRTVEYLRVMVDKVKNLEGAKCQKCGESLQDSAKAAASSEDDQTSRTLKRKRGAYVEESSIESNKSRHPDTATIGVPETTTCPQSSTEPQPPRLPSISSWMSMDPPLSGPSPLANSHAYQLPSPPHTAPFAPITITSSGFPPRLVLPSPIAPNSPAAPARHRGPNSSCQGSSPHTYSTPLGPFSTRDRDVPELPLDMPTHKNTLLDPASSSSNTHHSTLRSPSSTHHILPSETSADADARHGRPLSPWSRDDQTAASLLLNISSRPRDSRAGSGSGSESGSTGNETFPGSHSIMSGEHRERSPLPLQEQHLKSTMGADIMGGHRGGDFYEAQTPRSVLGMGEGSGGGDTSTRTM